MLEQSRSLSKEQCEAKELWRGYKSSRMCGASLHLPITIMIPRRRRRNAANARCEAARAAPGLRMTRTVGLPILHLRPGSQLKPSATERPAEHLRNPLSRFGAQRPTSWDHSNWSLTASPRSCNEPILFSSMHLGQRRHIEQRRRHEPDKKMSNRGTMLT